MSGELQAELHSVWISIEPCPLTYRDSICGESLEGNARAEAGRRKSFRL